MDPILIVEDDKDLSELIKIQLTDQDYSIEQCFDGTLASQLLRVNAYSLVVLDVMLPGKDGFSICREFRELNSRTPILMLTAKAEEIDKINGLEFGADDYLTKPFSVKEFIARVKALLRRAGVHANSDNPSNNELQFGELTIFPIKRTVELKGVTFELTSKEFDLLMLFANNPGRAYSRQQLLDEVWGYQYNGYSHTVNSHINRLRSKIEDDPANPTYIKTVWGVGYRFVELEELAV